MERTKTNIIEATASLCQHCYECVRKCPVKAIKITDSELEVVGDRCIACGACVVACTQKAFRSRDNIGEIKELMAKKDVVAVTAPEIDAVFSGTSRSQLRAALMELGFYAVEDMVIAEEMVAMAYSELLSRDTDRPVIRSTCPSIVAFVEKYKPEMVRNLAPIASPMIVQGRLVKLLYGDVAVVFIGPCIAKQSEIERDPGDAVDQVLTFDRLVNMFKEVDIDPGNYQVEDDDRPVVGRVFSTPGGFPVNILENSSEKDRLMISRSLGSVKQVLSKPHSGANESGFLDLLNCHGCVDGPAFGEGSRRSRLLAIGDQTTKQRMTMDFKEFTKLPEFDMTQVFAARPSEKKVSGREGLEEELSSVGLSDPQRQLNCSLCGYETCAGHAGAVIMGLSDWSACLPEQRRLLQEKASRLKEATHTDGLTSLVNHRGFVEMLAAEFHRHVRYKTGLSVIMSDVDSFKQINDIHGHLQGDKVLKLLAQILVQNLRETDIAARYGGDEFAIILPEISREEAVVVAEKLRAKVADTVFWLGEDIRERVSLSLGICAASERDTDPMMFLNRADKALYKAKQAGRNRTVIAE